MENDYFYEMIDRWLVNDHFNPGIKAEVIWDMLLSEFVGELVWYSQQKVYKGTAEDWKKDAQNYRLILKEFPIQRILNDNEDKKLDLSNAKVDYVVVNDKQRTVYFVELKTTNDSFDDTQYNRYISLESGKVWDFYCKVMRNNIHDSYLGVDIGIDRRKNNYSRNNYRIHVKHYEQLKKMIGREQVLAFEKTARVDIDGAIEALWKAFKNVISKYADYKIKIVYLSLDTIEPEKFKNNIDFNRDGVVAIAINELEDFEEKLECIDESKYICWQMIKKIISKVTEKNLEYVLS